MSNVHKEAFLAREAGPEAMKDGLVETAGLPDEELSFDPDAVDLDESAETDEESGEEESEDEDGSDETEEILDDPDTVAAIEEGLADLEAGDVEVGEDEEPGEDTVEAYNELTIPELKEIADSRDIEYLANIHKDDLVELLVSV